MAGKCIIVFARYPEAGKVKTRLAKSIGDKKAAALYKALAEEKLLAADKTGYNVVVAASDKNDIDRFKNWLGRDRVYFGQKGKDLGARMKNACKRVFKSGYAKAVLIGTDCPGLDAGVLKTAFRKLEKTNIVIGPAVDGGYYLIGFRQAGFYEKLFDKIKWSTDKVLKQTMNKLKAGKRKVVLLKTLRDIDTLDDLMALKIKGGSYGGKLL